jgi:hypothetical protein
MVATAGTKYTNQEFLYVLALKWAISFFTIVIGEDRANRAHLGGKNEHDL